MLHEFEEVELREGARRTPPLSSALAGQPMPFEHTQSLLLAVLTVSVVFTVITLTLVAVIGGALEHVGEDRPGLQEEPRQSASPSPTTQPTVYPTLPVATEPASPPPDPTSPITLPPPPTTAPPPPPTTPLPLPTPSTTLSPTQGTRSLWKCTNPLQSLGLHSSAHGRRLCISRTACSSAGSSRPRTFK